METSELKICVSACLVGQPVRFDGSGKTDRFVVGELGRFAELVQVCPEVELGMPVPRPTLRLIGRAAAPTMVSRDGHDWTHAMRAYAERRVADLEETEPCGYVLRSKSPSCGMERVKVYDGNGVPFPNGRGLFAEVLMRQLPWLPVEEEGRLRDRPIREDFLDAVFALHRFREMVAGGFTAARLVDFHRRSKFQLLAHNPAIYRDLGRLVARAGITPLDRLHDRYRAGFMQCMRSRTAVKRHVNVLQHVAGFVKRRISGGSRREIVTTIKDYQRGFVPRSVPLVLLRHHAREHGVTYLDDQSYFDPFPLRLMMA